MTIVATGKVTVHTGATKPHFSVGGARPTGSELAARLRRAADERGASLSEFIKPLANYPSRFLCHLEFAARPKSATIERIEALIAGRPVPPLAAPVTRVSRTAPLIRRGGDHVADRPRVDRDPCPFCATRRDIGCRHIPRTGPRIDPADAGA